MRIRFILAPLCACIFFLPLSAAFAEEAPANEQGDQGASITIGSTVTVEYTLSLDDGNAIESNVGAQPLIYRQGTGEMLLALEQQLDGMRANETRRVTLSPESAYGRVDTDLRQTVNINLIPEQARVLGFTLVSTDPEGNERTARVHEINGEEVILDYNHPLAGQTLHFAVRIISVQ
jgi:FKBP-type peptidyl-prolyl cis-trans isomerase 2